MGRIFCHQAGIVAVGANAPGNSALYATIETERSDQRSGMTCDWGLQQDGTVAMAILWIYCDEVWLGDVSVTMGVVCPRVINVVRHPRIGGGAIKLDIALFQSTRSAQNSQATLKIIGAVRLRWDEG